MLGNRGAPLFLKKAESEFKYIDEVTEYNQQKMLKAFIDNGVSENIFAESTGYGYGDRYGCFVGNEFFVKFRNFFIRFIFITFVKIIIAAEKTVAAEVKNG